MNNKTLLYASAVFVLIFSVGLLIYIYIEKSFQKEVGMLKGYMVAEAKAHFDDMVTVRSWNASHGGIYVKQHDNLQPNPYLKENILLSKNNEILIKINPAWMTRQISAIANKEVKDGRFYKITSLKPLNPNNAPDKFEREALNYLEQHKNQTYYWNFSNKQNQSMKFNFMGSLKTTKNCLGCHGEQNYHVGDIRGGIRITLPTQRYNEIINTLEEKKSISIALDFFTTFFLFLILMLFIYMNNQHQKRIENKMILLQNILDMQNTIVTLTNSKKIQFANKKFFDFFNFKNLNQFLEQHNCICDKFLEDDSYFHLNKIDKNVNWVEYLYSARAEERFVKMLDSHNNEHIFAVHITQFNASEFIVSFSDVSTKMQSYLNLEKETLLENMLIAQSRVDAMSEILKAIGHQWRQPLMAISMINANMKVDAQLDTLDNESINTYTDEIDTSLHKLGNIIERFSEMFKPKNILQKDVKIQNIIDYVLDIQHDNLEDNHIKVSTTYHGNYFIDTYFDNFVEILLYIIKNAQEALNNNNNENREIVIDVSNINENIIIEIQNNGGTIAEDILPHIFEPYFTTKEILNEAGLSLFITKVTIEKYLKGTIKVQNIEDGVKFTITIRN